MKRIVSLLFLVGCQKPEVAPPPRPQTDTWDVSDSNNNETNNEGSLNAKGLYEGRLDDSALKEAFDAKQQEVLSCFQSGKKRNRYLEGDLRLSFELTKEGKAQQIFVASSTLGDSEVEGCFVTLLNTMALPKPAGGTVLAGYTFGYHPASKPAGAGAPNEEERVKYLLVVKDSLNECKDLPESFQAIVWIQPDGKALSAGYSAESPEVKDERACTIAALFALKYPKSIRKATYLMFTPEELQEVGKK